ncbi:putative bifunctional diguanylate cyclase/phosphodiesterase [Cellulomonas sp. P4]|uniref:putative bifunctional diguanylate cyclase/phosphodiesterase n=1 Tax=Cellulomonas sp. P4 TaxID=3142533 RepID=UPI0031BB4C0A
MFRASPHRSGAAADAAPRLRWAVRALAVLTLVAVVAAVSAPPELGVAAGAVTAAVAAVALRARVRQLTGTDAQVWRWAARSAAVVAVGLVVELAVRALPGDLDGVGLTAGAVLASAVAYQGLVRWNRLRTAVSDPGDWLNAIGSTLCALALGLWVVRQLPDGAAAAVPVVALVGHLVRLAVMTVMLGTALTVSAIADLRRDARALTLVGVIAGLALIEVGGLLRALRLGEDAPGVGPGVVLAWTGFAVALAVASMLPRARSARRYASSRATTTGSIVVIVAGVVLLLLDVFTAGSDRSVALLAALGVFAASGRVFHLVGELSQLATSRIEARTDPLTGVANRRALIEAVADASDGEGGAALLIVDLDKFKDVNDRFGHAVGDAVLVAVAARLDEAVAGRGLLARLGGDEFAVVLPGSDAPAAVRVAQRLAATVAEPVDVADRTIHVASSIGVACTALEGRAQGELLRRADAAMYLAKRAGGGIRVFDHEADIRARAERELLEDLRAMLTTTGGEHGRLVLHYQPQVDVATGRPVGVEALVRWDHPTHGVLPPVAFLDLAEAHGVMQLVTWQVLSQATAQAVRWRDEGLDLRVAVNLSTSCLEEPQLLGVIDQALVSAGLPSDRLVVEITETSLMRDPQLAIRVTQRIAAQGIGVSIDDYGTGYSSLAYLNDLPAEELKIDRSFTARLTADPRTRAIVAGTVQLGHHLGLHVVAEGVEDAETLGVLRRLGCDRSQGYFHSRPLPAAELTATLRRMADGAHARA